jgi:hypothetical protein
MLGVRDKVPGPILLDRVNLVDFVFAEPVGRQAGGPERQCHNNGGGERQRTGAHPGNGEAAGVYGRPCGQVGRR